MSVLNLILTLISSCPNLYFKELVLPVESFGQSFSHIHDFRSTCPMINLPPQPCIVRHTTDLQWTGSDAFLGRRLRYFRFQLHESRARCKLRLRHSVRWSCNALRSSSLRNYSVDAASRLLDLCKKNWFVYDEMKKKKKI